MRGRLLNDYHGRGEEKGPEGVEKGRERRSNGGGVGRAGAPGAFVRSAEAASARDSKTSVMCHSPLLADCSWIKD